MNARFHDPAGERYGIPTYPWRAAPQHLRTKRQLAQENLRPVDEYEAQVLRNSRYGLLRAYLYDSEAAVPKREPTPAQLESLRIARWVRSVDACERRGVDASDMRELIVQARADLAARRATQAPDRRAERSR
ncbi:hypothetical protein [Nocardia huaxiensis]|uniref:Uncharacterized protein n=1 Tax=Nocardia huaxiensis TaxID=2755382 RepID=A0A7D7A1Z9_9NOCA|nr:hypothetical protein [Nocardia huaxiensis]QLY33989.1 hypothetical protein H0264_18695 [Nocardia huaxiensis]UFS99108.1 hypothetical protein LPY97_15015 [Nocardia huaxiensis]